MPPAFFLDTFLHMKLLGHGQPMEIQKFSPVFANIFSFCSSENYKKILLFFSMRKMIFENVEKRKKIQILFRHRQENRV